MARNYKLAIRIEERNEEATQAEKNGDPEKAARLYERNIKEDYPDKLAFERLMVIYRKQKRYKDELRVINRGIEVFRENIENHILHSLRRHIDSRKLEQLSKAIMATSGQKKEDTIFPDPIDKWMKRKKIVDQKLKK